MTLHVVRKRRTLPTDQRRAKAFRDRGEAVLTAAMSTISDNDREGFARALVQCAIENDAAVRGGPEAVAWAARCARELPVTAAPSLADRVFKTRAA